MAKRYYLYERKRPGRLSIWYVRFRAADGTIGSPLSTGQCDEEAADTWAVERLLSNETVKAREPRVPTFGEWAEPWWVWESCPYIRELQQDGYPISRNYARIRRSYLTRHLIPAIGKIPMTQLSPRHFRDMKDRLKKAGKLKPASINRILGTARIMLNYAVRMGDLEKNPVKPIRDLHEEPEARGIFTLSELHKLFGPGSYKDVWHEEPRHFGMNLLAASTGMRLGEVQALQVRYVHDGYVEVRHSWDDKWRLSPPKWGSARVVTVPALTSAAIQAVIGLHRWGDLLPEDLVFWGRDRSTPLTKTAILQQFKAAVSRSGIPEAERARRVLLFHSYRHTFNTLVRGRVPDEQLRRVTGHKALAMTDNYDHAAAEHLADVKAEQEKLYPVG